MTLPLVLMLPHGGALSHTSRLLLLARALRGSARVEFAGEGRWMELPAGEGFPVHELPDLPHRETLSQVRRGRFRLPDDLLDRLVRAEADLFRRLAPAAVVADARPTARLSAEWTGTPHAAVINAAVTGWYAPRIEPLRPARWRRVLLGPFMPGLRRLALAAAGDNFRRCARRLDLAEPADPLIGKDLTLVADAVEFAPLSGAPEKVHSIGPLAWSPPGEPPELPPGEAPLVYVTLGSTGPPGAARRLGELAATLAAEGLRVVIGGRPEFPGGNPPEGVVWSEVIPAPAILPHTAAVVCHGGNGTIYQALAAGIPVVAVPDNPDQVLHAQRLAQLGCGLWLDETVLQRPLKVAAAVRSVLEGPVAEEARRWLETLGWYRADQAGAQLVSELAGGPVEPH